MIQLNSKVDIIRITKTKGELGGFTEAETTLHNNLPCRINWKRGSEKIFFAKNTYFRDARMFCKVVDIDVKDKVRYNSKTYEIVDIANVDESSRYMTLDLKLTE